MKVSHCLLKKVDVRIVRVKRFKFYWIDLKIFRCDFVDDLIL